MQRDTYITLPQAIYILTYTDKKEFELMKGYKNQIFGIGFNLPRFQ